MFITSRLPVRYSQVVVLWMAIVLNYVLRINMSVGVVAMTSNKFASDFGHPVYSWTEAEKGRVLSSFFWGYMVLQIFFGNTVERIGTKNVLAVSVIVTSLTTIMIPFVAEYGYMVIMALRVIEGLSQGALYPCVTVHISKWVPPVERVRSLSLCFSGSAFGPLIGFPLCGYLAAGSGGWPSVFYVTGGFGFVWVVLWLWIGANSPKEHASISNAERTYIETAIQHDVRVASDVRTPWKEILTSVPLYAMVIASIVEMWGFWTLLAEMPNYLSAVLNLDMKENGLLSSLPYLCAYVTTILYSCVASYVTKNFKISKTLHRNIWNSIAMWGSATALIILSLTDKPSTFTAVMMLVVTVSLMTAKYNGYMTNPIDLSPNFCGTLVGIVSTAGTLGPIFGPLCVGWLVDDPTSEEQWNIVFRLCSAIMFTGNLMYVILSSSEVQSWNDQTINKHAVSMRMSSIAEKGETNTKL